MERVGIWERGGAIARLFRALLPEKRALALRMVSRPLPFPAEEPFDLLLLGTARAGSTQKLPACRLLLLPGGEAALASRCHCFCAMSYGLSERDSLTLSGNAGGYYALSIQRELLTLTGRPVERQEIILPRRTKDPLTQMAAAALLLLSDFAPEDLAALFKPLPEADFGAIL